MTVEWRNRGVFVAPRSRQLVLPQGDRQDARRWALRSQLWLPAPGLARSDVAHLGSLAAEQNVEFESFISQEAPKANTAIVPS
jgi:hypothetical protein